jgi:hypothetical protein
MPAYQWPRRGSPSGGASCCRRAVPHFFISSFFMSSFDIVSFDIVSFDIESAGIAAPACERGPPVRPPPSGIRRTLCALIKHRALQLARFKRITDDLRRRCG